MNEELIDKVHDLAPMYDPMHKCGIVTEKIYREVLSQLRDRANRYKTLAESNGKLAHDNAIVAMRYKEELATLRLQLAKQITPS